MAEPLEGVGKWKLKRLVPEGLDDRAGSGLVRDWVGLDYHIESEEGGKGKDYTGRKRKEGRVGRTNFLIFCSWSAQPKVFSSRLLYDDLPIDGGGGLAAAAAATAAIEQC